MEQCLMLSISEVLYATLLYKVLYLLANNSAILSGSDASLTVVDVPADLPVILRTSAQKIPTFVAKHRSSKPMLHDNRPFPF